MSSKSSSSIKCDDRDVIPTIHTARTLVLCFDGTGDCFDADNSNVVRFCSLLKKDDRTQQLVYYQAGIGTYTTPKIATPGMVKILKLLDMAFAWNLDAHVMEGYEFLMQNYSAGDKICLFGFSRGAYTARALAGMVHKVGLLPASNHQQIPFAYKMYSRNDKICEKSKGFKETFSMDVEIDFIGVWDTVNSVGIIPHHLPFTSSNSSIRIFRHALSLDEHRTKFRPNFYHWSTGTEGTTEEMPKGDVKNEKSGEKQPDHTRGNEDDIDRDETKKVGTDVLEVWFAGCHTDVGGGSVKNDSRRNLARIPLRWMIRQCFLTNTGILFHGKLLQDLGLDLSTLNPGVKRPPALPYPPTTPASTRETPGTTKTLVNPRDSPSSTFKGDMISADASSSPTGIISEEDEDLKDSLCRTYDQLQCMPLWWILELIPIIQPIHREDNKIIVRNPVINFGQPRKILRQKQGVNVHRSVKTRMDAGDAVERGKYLFKFKKNAGDGIKRGPYHPRAKWMESVTPNWVD